MAITYAVKKIKNPNGIEGTEYFHGQAIKTGELTMEKLARRIVFRPDVELKKAVAMDFSLKRVSSEVME